MGISYGPVLYQSSVAEDYNRERPHSALGYGEHCENYYAHARVALKDAACSLDMIGPGLGMTMTTTPD